MYPLCFEEQTQGIVLHLPFKVELPTNDFQDISFLVSKSIQTRKHCCDAIELFLFI